MSPFACVWCIVLGKPPCEDSPVWPFAIDLNKLARMQRMDDPRHIPSCAQETAWFRPLDQMAVASDGVTVAALPILEPRASVSNGDRMMEFIPTWLEFAHRAPPRFCVVEINEPAIILSNGLVVTSSHRYDLGMDWARTKLSTDCSLVYDDRDIIFSFRFRYSQNAKRSAAKMLPLLSVAHSRIIAANASILSSGSILFDFFASWATHSKLITSRSQHVLANRVRLVVRHPEDSRVPNYWQRPNEINGAFPAGICMKFAQLHTDLHSRNLNKRLRLLYLPRTTIGSMAKNAATLSHSGRHFDNEDALIDTTRRMAQQLNFDFKLFTFNTLQDQMRAFSEADIIAGPQGTASSGLVFAKPDVIMVEFILQRYDTVELMNAWLPHGAYIAVHPHWYYGANARNPETCGGTCTGWHLTAHDLQTWERTIRCLFSSAQCRSRALAVSTASARWSASARTFAFPSWPHSSRANRTCTLLRYALPARIASVMYLHIRDKAQVRQFRAAYNKQYTIDAHMCGEHDALRQLLA